MTKIALVGKSQALKTWCSWYLYTYYNFNQKGMSDGVSPMLRKYYDYGKYERLRYPFKIKFYDALYRLDPNIWIGYMERRLRHTESDIVIDDVRYENELQRLEELGFIIVRLEVEDSSKKLFDATYLDAAPGNLIYSEWYGKKVGADFTVVVQKQRWRNTRVIDNLMDLLDKPKKS